MGLNLLRSRTKDDRCGTLRAADTQEERLISLEPAATRLS